jgi:hypothetical protein
MEFQPHWKIMVHIYANLHGLAQTYHSAHVVDTVAIARQFFSGFNRQFPLWMFVDAGNDKEAADYKIKGMWEDSHGSKIALWCPLMI